MIYRIMADIIVVGHFCFILWVIVGGFFVLRWPRAAWFHIPIVLYGISIEFFGWVCWFTPFENRLRHMAGQTGYTGSFTEHYILPMIYPGGLTRTLTTTLGILLVVLTVVVYGLAIRRHRRRSDA